MPRWVVNLLLCLLPLGLSPGFFYLIAESYLNFGGGEKDLLLLIPWLVWSVLYAVLFVIFWVKGWPPRRSCAYAVGGATGLHHSHSCCIAPEGRKKIAQGVSPGNTGRRRFPAPAGAKANSRWILSPLRGSFRFTNANPRLTPWATLCRPYGARNCYTATMKMA